MQSKSDLYVIKKVKDLTKYVISVTEKSPKKYRFTLVARIQNYCLDIIEDLFIANKLPIGNERLNKQQEAGRKLSLVGYLGMLYAECGCILPNQYEYLSKLEAEALLFLGKWITSDKNRINKMGNNSLDT